MSRRCWARYTLKIPKKSRLRRSWARYALDTSKKIAPAALLGPPRLEGTQTTKSLFQHMLAHPDRGRSRHASD